MTNGATDVSTIYNLFGDTSLIEVDRAIAEMRAGRPVLLYSDGGVFLVLGAETASSDRIAAMADLAGAAPSLVLTPTRLNVLGRSGEDEPMAIEASHLDSDRIQALISQPGTHLHEPLVAADPAGAAALQLAKLALLLPAVLMAPVSAASVLNSAITVQADAIGRFGENRSMSVEIVSRAPVPLLGAKACEFVVFRGGEGMREQVAVVVGDPDPSRPVLVRLHSACLTGDLFGSLRCDCGDQLRSTVAAMAKEGGGVLLYLDQEGRGTGIANKIRAYRLQHGGLDTYDADETLGFGLDSRRFEFAAQMLLMLGFSRIVLLTNNPEKIGALRRAGIDIKGIERIYGRRGADNVSYLAAKRDRAGHAIDLDALDHHGPAISDRSAP